MLINDGNPRQWTIWRIWEKKIPWTCRERTYVVSFMYIDAYVYTFMYEYAHVCVLGGLCASAREIEERRARDARADFSTSICGTSVADFGG